MHIRRNSGLSTTRIDLKMCESVKQSKISEPYLITRDDEASEILQERLFRERRDHVTRGIFATGVRIKLSSGGLIYLEVSRCIKGSELTFDRTRDGATGRALDSLGPHS